MAGGIGSRFWPESTSKLPKQFHSLVNGRSLLQNTFDRFNKLVPDDQIFVITSSDYKSLTSSHLPTLKPHQIICEPMRRNTAPATLLGTLVANKLDSNSVCIFTPADATIADVDLFLADIDKGAKFLTDNDGIVTLGIDPTEAHTGYGYIHYDKQGEVPYKVHSFKEKPTSDIAEQYLTSGEYLWNAGIFLWRSNYLLTLFEQLAPEMFEQMKILRIDGIGQIDADQLKVIFSDLENISVDFLIMERAPLVYTIPGNFGWSDIGNWRALHGYLKKDKNQNVAQAEKHILKNTNNCLIRTKGQKLIVIKGLKDYCVVENDDVLMIYPLGDEQEIKIIRQEVEDNFGEQYI